MIRLYKKETMEFNTNGVGNLHDAISCIVTEERNGQYELTMVYPITGIHFEEVTPAAVVLAPSGPGKSVQAFDIYRITKPIDGKVTVHARHITYRASKIPVGPFSASSAAEALAGLKANAAEECPFEFWTDKETEANFSVTEPSSIRSRLGGNAGSILDVYGGEYEFDMYTIKLHGKRGTDSDVTLRYGNNITDFRQEESIANTITGIYPFWKGQDDYLELPEKVIRSENYASFPYAMTIPVDFTFEFEEKPTEDQLRAAAERYMSQAHIGVPSVSIKVAFAALWQTEEYKNIAPLLKVGLCDDVTVEFPELKISAKAEVVRTVYNVLLDRYDSIDLGDARVDLADNIVSQSQAIAEKPSKSQLASAVKKATNLITGVNGGYVILHQDANGQPYEILIMDTDSIDTAQNVWRWNKNGWGHSSTGYNGPYKLAATIDGGIVADFITSGTMQATRIKGGALTLGGKDNGNGVMEIRDGNGALIITIDKSGINAPARGSGYITPTVTLSRDWCRTQIEGYGMEIREYANYGGMNYEAFGMSAICTYNGEEKVLWNSYVSGSTGPSYSFSFKNPNNLDEIVHVYYETIKALVNGYTGQKIIGGETFYFDHGVLQS